MKVKDFGKTVAILEVLFGKARTKLPKNVKKDICLCNQKEKLVFHLKVLL